MSPELDGTAEFDSNLNAPTSFTLSGHRLLLARLGWLMMFLLTLGLFVASIPAYYDSLISFSDPELDAAAARASLEAAGVTMDFYARYLVPISVAYTMVYFVVGTVIFWRRSDNWIALFASMCLITMGTFGLDTGPADALADQYSTAWLPVHLLALLATVSIYTLVLIFPNGRFVPRWTRWAVILFAVHDVFFYLFPDSIFNLARSSYLLDSVVLSIVISVPIVSQIYRFRYVSTQVERQQTKWVVFGVVSASLGVLAFEVPVSGSPLGQFGPLHALAIQAGLFGSQLLLPLSIGIAIVYDRLWDIDIIINRTLVYGSLSGCVVLIYVLTVGGLGALFQARGNLGVSLLATGLVAVLFQPLRSRLQRGVNRLMYGERDDPYAVTSRLGRRIEATLEPEGVLPTVVETIAQALKLPYAAILLKEGEGFRSAAVYGSPTAEPEALPLVYQREEIGRLVIAPRAPGEQFSAADRTLLEDLARQAEVAVHAVRLTADLQSSRERLVSTREEERRRLRRDLHDGIGPTLTGVALQLNAARKLVRSKPGDAEESLARIEQRTEETIAEMRRLIYGLRPPALDDLGLIPSIHQQAQSQGMVETPVRTNNTDGRSEKRTVFSMDAPEELPRLPAAVEVACYRIVQEAITNVARHAYARTCYVSLSVDRGSGVLEVEITDDGVGIPGWRVAGVGLSSMRERAEELGGTLTVERGPEGGTRVLARLPMPAPKVCHRGESPSWRAPSAS